MNDVKILFVDEEEKVFNSFKREVSFLPVDLYYAGNGEEALKILEEQNIDLLISDERMTGITGSELISIVRERFPMVVSIIITGYADFDSIIKAVNSGQVCKYILKPWNKLELIMTIKNAIEYKRDKELILNLKSQLREKEDLLSSLEKRYPGISSVKKDKEGNVILDLEG
ncbi:response regulator [Calditerrivibrio nitroreducens]|uniref:Response regulator receiver protein n=1 Tax=Calditerrivibrio nitroreducens (strain DSM 19672 / NBRC 101217 / Yu37-1) TaxID=768670 RepID=E4TGU9_CALNY|nr:response regulator [Calditerrivibrio nitroreducens]ADR18709.1 response regulator receiver protein [Calditerrivibrio nitroreducens DSM 19672]